VLLKTALHLASPAQGFLSPVNKSVSGVPGCVGQVLPLDN